MVTYKLLKKYNIFYFNETGVLVQSTSSSYDPSRLSIEVNHHMDSLSNGHSSSNNSGQQQAPPQMIPQQHSPNTSIMSVFYKSEANFVSAAASASTNQQFLYGKNRGPGLTGKSPSAYAYGAGGNTTFYKKGKGT